MPRTKNSSSLPAAGNRLIDIPLERLHAHPLNANVMSDEQFEKLTRNIEREGDYPPPVVRPHPDQPDDFQLIDGENRVEALRRLGWAQVHCYVWPCDDETALILLTTLNRLSGEDVPVRRAALLRELTALLPAEELALLLPEDASAIADTLDLLDLDSERLLADLTSAAAQVERDAPRLISFAVTRADEIVIEQAIADLCTGLTGKNRRGRALALLAKGYLEGSRDE